VRYWLIDWLAQRSGDRHLAMTQFGCDRAGSSHAGALSPSSSVASRRDPPVPVLFWHLSHF
jgi:hypothetical protein